MKRSILKLLSLAFGKRIALTNDPVVGEATTTFALSSKLQASRMFLKGIMCCALVVACVSCKSHNVPRIAQIDTDRNESHFLQRVDTVVVRDSVLVRDSVVQRERTIHDTVYITKEVYRDRLEARGERQKAVRTDTVVVTEWREKVIEHPPERYVPKFYKWCTGLFWAIGLLVMGYWLLKWWLKRLL
jgi:hypothetical protein